VKACFMTDLEIAVFAAAYAKSLDLNREDYDTAAFEAATFAVMALRTAAADPPFSLRASDGESSRITVAVRNLVRWGRT
jgi:hypothetical protein